MKALSGKMLLVALGGAVGARHRVTSHELARRLKGAGFVHSSDAITRVVWELRQEGIALCGDPRDGFFIAETAGELLDECNKHRAVALEAAAKMHAAVKIEAALRGISERDLYGSLGDARAHIQGTEDRWFVPRGTKADAGR